MDPIRAWSALMLLWFCAPFAQGEGPAEVEIRGGLDESGQWFRWTVTNNGAAPLTELDFPQDQGDLLQPPPEWTYRWIETGTPEARDGRARVIATARTTLHAIPPGGARDFELRVSRGGVQTGHAVVYARFADGKEVAISGVQTPRGPSAGERYGTLIGYAVIVAIIAALAIRQRRRPPAAEAAPDAPAE